MGSLHRAEIKQVVDIPRRCDHCTKEYTFEYLLCVFGEDYNTSNKWLMNHLQKRATEQINGVVADVSSFGTYCPECRQFSKACMTHHFPNGIRAGLEELLATKMQGNDVKLRARRPWALARTAAMAFLAIVVPLAAMSYLPIRDYLSESNRAKMDDLFGPRTSIVPEIVRNHLLSSILLAGMATAAFCVAVVLLACRFAQGQNRILLKGRAALGEIDDPSTERFLREMYITDRMRIDPDAVGWAKSLSTAQIRWGDKRPAKFSGVCPNCRQGAGYKTFLEYLSGAMGCKRCGKGDPYGIYSSALLSIIAVLALLGVIIHFIQQANA